MDDEPISIEFSGDIVERQELLNGSVTVTFEATSEDGTWTLSGSLTWNRGLEAGSEEGDLSLAGPEGELFASLAEATVVPSEDAESAYRVTATYEADGGSGRFAEADARLALEGTLGAELVMARLSIST